MLPYVPTGAHRMDDDETMQNNCQLWSKLFHRFVLGMIYRYHYERNLESSGAFFGLLRGYNFQKTIWTTAITRGVRHKRKNIASKSCGDVPERTNGHNKDNFVGDAATQQLWAFDSINEFPISKI